MDQGKQTPPHVIDYMRHVMEQVPGIQRGKMKIRVEERFDIKLDVSTVGRHMKKIKKSMHAGSISDRPDPEPGASTTDQLTLERIKEHQGDLLEIITSMRHTVDSYPFTDIDRLRGTETPPSIPWDGVDYWLWDGLSAHLEGDGLWNLLSDWHEACGEFAKTLRAVEKRAIEFGEETFEAPFTQDNVRPSLSVNLPAAVKKAVLVERGADPHRDRVDLCLSTTSDLTTSNGSYVVIGMPFDLDEAKRRFSSVVDQVQTGGFTERIDRDLKRVLEARAPLSKRLAYFHHRREAPGICDVCRPVPISS